jgi:uncharacterized protein (TIGR02145 family)
MKIINRFFFITFVLGCIILTTQCKTDELIKVTKLQTGNISNITYNSASASATFIDIGDNVSSYGHCWNTSGAPTISDEKYTVSSTAKKGEYISSLSGLTGNTKYFVRAYVQDGGQVVYGNEINFTTSETPFINVTCPSSANHWVGGETHTITWNENISGNVIISLYKNNLFNKEIVISPGILSSGTKSWEIPTDLEYGTDYSIKIFCVDDDHIIGQSEHFEIIMPLTDYDGNSYKLVKIGIQWWMKENLKTTHLNGGRSIPDITYFDDWRNRIDLAYCWYQNTENPNKDKFGALYNFYCNYYTEKICPVGWHVPSVSDWNLLITYLTDNGYGYEGSGDDIAKSLASNTDWLENAQAGTVGNSLSSNNSSGFNAMSSGFRYGDDGQFFGLNDMPVWWSSTTDNNDVWCFYLRSTGNKLSSEKFNKKFGCSVRCIKD